MTLDNRFAMAILLFTASGVFASDTGPGASLAAPVEMPSKQAPEQKAKVEKLGASLATVVNGAEASQAQSDELKAQLLGLVSSPAKPDEALVGNLAVSLSTALSSGDLSDKRSKDLARVLDIVMNGGTAPRTDVEKALKDAKTLFAGSGLDAARAKVVLNDLKKIADSLKR